MDFSDAVADHIAAITAAAGRALGHVPPLGTTVVGTPDRAGSTMAVAYPLGDRTLIWCSLELRDALGPLTDPSPLSLREFVERCTPLGGVVVGSGHHRVLARPAPDPGVEPARLVVLDRDDIADRRLIEAFVRDCPPADLDEAELAMDELDEAILGILDRDGALASLASARPWTIDAGVDDIAVITHPEHRGSGLATAAVAALSQHRQRQGRKMFYNCDVDNTASNRVAEAVGFELVVTVTGVSFS